jgi:putative tricarboxylic transport membrane protein
MPETAEWEERSIHQYVEGQLRDEEDGVTLVQRVGQERVLGRTHLMYDVHTVKGRWWVITEMTNLYDQKRFPELDYTLSFLIGLMPGAGPTVAAILAYVTEKRFSKHPERFGEGAIDGVAAAESANNSAAHGALIPMLALGIPGSASTAVLLAALVLQGIRPGPTLLVEQADLVWGLVASMFIGNVILLVLNLPLAPAFGALLRIPYEYLAPGILVISLVGTFATTLSLFSVGLTLFFGMVGYLMMKADLPRAPVVLAVVLAQLMETSLRQSLMLSEGTLWIFLERPLSIVLLLLVIGSLALPLLGLLTRHRTERRRRAEAKISIATE